MNSNVIDAALMAKMFLAGARNLEQKKEWINELNVFPVPDGDTGTNMTLTILRFAARCQRKLRRYPVTALQRLQQDLEK